MSALAEQVEQLRAELASLRAELRTEVRTRRLVVVDEAGAERIYTDVNGGFAELSVAWDSDGNEARAIVGADTGHDAGFYVSAAHVIVAMLTGDVDGNAGHGSLHLERHVDDETMSNFTLDADGRRHSVPHSVSGMS